MTINKAHIKIGIISLFADAEMTDFIINNFCELFVTDKIFGKPWGLKRIKNNEIDNSIYVGGGRMNLPKKQISFINITPPESIYYYLENEPLSNNIEWCNLADIFLFCIDINHLPEIWKINRLSYLINQVDREKTILYAVFTDFHFTGVDNFKKYTDLVVSKHIELTNGETESFSDELNNILQNGYLFPYTDIQSFVGKGNKCVKLRENVFSFDKTDKFFGYFDCLLYILNTIYLGENVSIALSNNQLYHYLTSNNNTKYNTNMAKSIKIAVVGTQDNGKSHCISDIFRTLKLMGIDVNVKPFYGYQQVVHYLNNIVGKKTIKPTDIENFTRKDHHHKGYLAKINREVEFMDIPGEAFRDAESITGIYSQLKFCLEYSYTHKLWKRILNKLPKKIRQQLNISPINYFIEKTSAQGKLKTLALYKAPTETTTQAQSLDDNSTNSLSEKSVQNRRGFKYISGKDVVAKFEQYDTDNLKSVLKQIVAEQSENYQSLSSITDAFWQNFYAYVFCDKCTDMILCELLALPKETAAATVNTDQENFSYCLNGIKTFFERRSAPNLYIAFKGLDAMLNPGNFKKLYNTQNIKDIVDLSPKTYYLVHLAIYKKYGCRFVSNFDDFFNAIINSQNSFLNEENNNIGLRTGNIPKELEEILLDESDFLIPRDINNNGLSALLANRVQELQYAYAFGARRFLPLQDTNVTKNVKNIILPHVYFTAYPIDGIHLTVHKNKSTNRQEFEGLNLQQRLPFGTFNLVVDLLNANGITDYNNNSNMENFLI